MKDSTKNEVQGKVHEVKGTVKEKVGKATNNPDLELEGQDEQTAGTVQPELCTRRAFRASVALS